jgi:7-alpha-hydroxysteroid dehydrogenase
MASGLTGKSVIVTGAARGVGRAVARAFVKAGASVMLADVDETRLETAVETLTEAGLDGRATAFACDLREKLAMINLMAATMDAHEGIDILVNASRLLVASDPLDPDADRLEETLAQNVTANLRLTQIVARRMIALGTEATGEPEDRAIVNVTSVFAQRARPDLLAYSVASAALDQLTRGLALALAPHHIRVNGLAVGGLPGRALTEALTEIDDLPEALGNSVPLGRAGEPRDYADAALFLASPAARFVTGQVLAVDGGRLLVDPLDTTRS